MNKVGSSSETGSAEVHQCLNPLSNASAADSTPDDAASASSAVGGAATIFDSARWHFTFLGETFFVTAFAPCYPSNHARYQFVEEAARDARDKGASAEEARRLCEEYAQHCYVLFQPELVVRESTAPRRLRAGRRS